MFQGPIRVWHLSLFASCKMIELLPPRQCFYTFALQPIGRLPAGSASTARRRCAGRASCISTPEQVHLPANRLYRARTDLLLLHIDPARLDRPLRWEPGVPSDPGSMLFPHLYGPLPVAAVVAVGDYRPGPDGSFPPFAPVPST